MRATLSLLLVFGFSFGSGETVTFDSANPGFIPPGWSVSSTNSARPARWQVRVDKTAPSRPYVFAQLSNKSGVDDYSLALFDKSACKDGDVSVDLKLVSGKLSQGGGLIWRFRDTGNYYFALASVDKQSVGIYRKTNNAVSQLAHASVPHLAADDEWNLLKVSFRGPKFVLFFGHRKLMEAQDGTLSRAGKAGLWTKADTVAYFDNFRINQRSQ